MSDAAILAAGLGSRLGSGLPKCLTVLAGDTLLGHMLRALAQAGVQTLTVVTGWRGDAIDGWLSGRDLPLPVRTVANPDYTGPSILSLHHAIRATAGPLLLIESDLMLDPGILADLLRDPRPDLVPVGPPNNPLPFGVITDAAGRVTRWAFDPDSPNELIGVYKLSRATLTRLLDMVDGNYWDRIVDCADPLCALPCPRPWSEIDTPEDLARARAKWEG